MNLRKSLVAVATTASMLTLAACGGGDSSEQGGSGEASDSGVPAEFASGITVPYIDYPPYSLVDEDGELIGMDVEIVEALGEELGVPVEGVSSTFEASLLGVQQGKYLMAPAASITDERKETYDFVSFFSDRYRVMVLADAPEIGDDPIELCGLSVGATTGGVALGYMEQFNEECEAAGEAPIDIKTFPDEPANKLAVESGRIDAAASTLSNGSYVTSQTDTLKVTGPEYSVQVQGFALQKGSEFAEPLRDAMNAIIEDGTYQQILDKWNVGDAGIETAEINPDTGS